MHPFNKRRIFLKKSNSNFNFTQYQIKTLHKVHNTVSIACHFYVLLCTIDNVLIKILHTSLNVCSDVF